MLSTIDNKHGYQFYQLLIKLTTTPATPPTAITWVCQLLTKAILAEKGREKQAHGETAPGKTVLSIVDKSDKHNTRDTFCQTLTRSCNTPATMWVYQLLIKAQKVRHGVILSTIDKNRNHNTRDTIAQDPPGAGLIK